EHETIVAEYEPPEKIRPAQAGLLIDESSDTKDVTATIVDLAVRGYLTIAELPTTGILGLGKKDWSLTRTDGKAHPQALQDYELTIFNGLFGYGAMDTTQRAVVSLIRRFSDQPDVVDKVKAQFESKPTDVV